LESCLHVRFIGFSATNVGSLSATENWAIGVALNFAWARVVHAS